MADLLVIEESVVLAEEQDSLILIEREVETILLTDAQQGPPGPPGAKGDTSTIDITLTTTNPLEIVGGAIALPTAPMGGVVVWHMALVYLDLTPADFDTAGVLLADRAYLVEDHLVRVVGSSVVFTSPPPADGLHAVVSYLAAAP